MQLPSSSIVLFRPTLFMHLRSGTMYCCGSPLRRRQKATPTPGNPINGSGAHLTFLEITARSPILMRTTTLTICYCEELLLSTITTTVAICSRTTNKILLSYCVRAASMRTTTCLFNTVTDINLVNQKVLSLQNGLAASNAERCLVFVLQQKNHSEWTKRYCFTSVAVTCALNYESISYIIFPPKCFMASLLLISLVTKSSQANIRSTLWGLRKQ